MPPRLLRLSLSEMLERLRSVAGHFRRLLHPRRGAAPRTADRKPPPPSLYSASVVRAPQPKRYVVYTAVVGGYDDLEPPGFCPPNCDFVVFSDQPLTVDGWKVLPLNYLHPDPTRAARFVKLHPHIYFPEYDFSIWLDGNVGVKADIGAFLDRLTGDDFATAFPHPLRECVYIEGQECIIRRKDDEGVIRRHLERYRTEGIPENIGLWETNVLVRRHNELRCIKLMGAWWREIQRGSRRDQLSLSVVQREQSVNIVALDNPGVSAREHPLLTFSPHRPKRRPANPNVFWPTSIEAAGRTTASLTIGICVHNSLAHVKACLASVMSTSGEDDRIVVVDDASDEETANYLSAVTAGHPRIQLIRNATNLGYTRSANSILKSALTDWIVLLNSDTVVPKNALRKLIDAGEQYRQLAVIGPLSNAAGWQTVPRLTGPDGFLVNKLPRGATPDDMDRLCEQAALPVVQFVPLVNGFCFAVRRRTLEQIGLFDETSFPVGYGEEDDFCLRAADAGYACGIATNTFVFHSKTASFTPEGRKHHATAGSKAVKLKHTDERLAAAVTTMREHAGLKIVRERIGILQRMRTASASSNRAR